MPTNFIIAVTLSLVASRWRRIPLQMPRICLNKLGSETQATGTFSRKGDTLCVKVLSLPPFFPSPHIQRVDIPSSPRQEKLSFQCTAVWEAMQKNTCLLCRFAEPRLFREEFALFQYLQKE